MPWMIGIMVALTVLAAGGALALANFASQARTGLEGGLTVQIVAADPTARQAQAERARAFLQRQYGVTGVRVVPQAEIAKLVEPLLGEAASSDVIALPALIDLRFDKAADEGSMMRLRQGLRRVVPTGRIDAQAEWLGPVFGAIRAVRWLAMALIVLLTLASAVAVWLAARNALDANRETIEIVHHLGGNDAQIARIFQRSVLFDAVIGGMFGGLLGGAALLLLGTRFGALQSGLIQSGTLSALDWAVVALVPALTAAVAVLTARRTVMARLGDML